jgi:hypothetical protein
MGPQTSDIEKAAARRASILKSTATNIKNRAAELEIQHAEAELPPPTIAEQ